MLGYGIPETSLTKAVKEYDIDYIACDAGSIDQGPNYLAQGKLLADSQMVERDLRLLLSVRNRLDVPLMISSAGGSGSKEHVDSTVDIVRKIAREEELALELAVIYTDVAPKLLHENRDSISVLDYQRDITPTDIENAKKIVAQIGPEPYVKSLEQGAEVVIGGRSIDEAPFAAFPLSNGMDEGLTFHMAKILECGAMASEPRSGSDCLIGTLTDSSFEVEPSNPQRRCTTQSVSAHTLYEKADPHTIYLPSGQVDTTGSTFEQISGRRVRVTDSEYTASNDCSVLLEGVEKEGYRTITIAGMRGTEATSQIDEIVSGVTQTVHGTVEISQDQYDLTVRQYGRDAVPLTESEPTATSSELGLIIDVVGDTQEIANTICSMARSEMLHHSFEGRLAVSGNLAIPYSPADIEIGAVYGFSIHHLLEDVAQDTIYSIQTEEIK
jgi:hypothetical protein